MKTNLCSVESVLTTVHSVADLDPVHLPVIDKVHFPYVVFSICYKDEFLVRKRPVFGQ